MTPALIIATAGLAIIALARGRSDKLGHFGAGLAICGWAVLAGLTPWAGLLAACTAGAGKEAWDATGRGHVEFWDFAVTAAGGCAGLIFLI